MDDMRQFIKELKHSIKFYLTVAGGPSVDLCMYMLKIIDVVDSMANNVVDEASKETMLIANEIVKSIAENVVNTIDKYAIENQLSEETVEAGLLLSELIDEDYEALPAQQIEHKNLMLSQINIALQNLSNHTNVKYPLITNSDGDEL
mgnify:CR=1 FL=1|tara:strand:+ start:1358 stop:1798 length:441 start_codon:yes stop_codon:yes gene_type:complete